MNKNARTATIIEMMNITNPARFHESITALNSASEPYVLASRAQSSPLNPATKNQNRFRNGTRPSNPKYALFPNANAMVRANAPQFHFVW